MVFYNENNILIRNMTDQDVKIICEEEIKQGWEGVSESKYLKRLKDQKDGKAVSIVAEYYGNAAGYNNIYINSERGAFANQGYCEIVDFGVLVKYRNQGIGSKLMDIAEQIASGYSDTVYLGVGLHEGYGIAQRMYVKRGYVPDGSGVWYGSAKCVPYESYGNDDDLNLYFSKTLKPK